MKTCKKCGNKKQFSEYYFRKDSGKYRNECKECISRKSSEYRKAKIQKIIDNGGHDYSLIDQKRKECFKCKKIKLGKFFYKVFEKNDGLSSYCKTCDTKYAKDRVFSNKSICYSEEELESKTKFCKKCHKEKSLIFMTKDGRSKDGYRNLCKECNNVENRKRKNTKSGRLKAYKISAKQRGVDWDLSEEEFLKFWKVPCSYCGNSIETIGIDRIDSSKGYHKSNIRSSCKVCNKMKLDMDFNNWIEHMERIIKFIKE